MTSVNGQAYTYDQNGNLTNDGEKTYIYNEENQLIEVKDQNGTSMAKFNYDHEGKRSSMTTSAGTTNFQYNGDKVIAETDANNTITAEYTWDALGNPVTMTKGGKLVDLQIISCTTPLGLSLATCLKNGNPPFPFLS